MWGGNEREATRREKKKNAADELGTVGGEI